MVTVIWLLIGLDLIFFQYRKSMEVLGCECEYLGQILCRVFCHGDSLDFHCINGGVKGHAGLEYIYKSDTLNLELGLSLTFLMELVEW